MGLDDLITAGVLIGLFLGLAALILARGYIRRNDLLYAAETLWYATLASLVCLGLMAWSLHWRVRSDLARTWQYLEAMEAKHGGQPH